MGVIEEMRRRINKIRWERWRAKQNKELKKSYCYAWGGDVPDEPTHHWENHNKWENNTGLYLTSSLGVFEQENMKYYSAGKWWYPFRISGVGEGRYVSNGDPYSTIHRMRVKVEKNTNPDHMGFKLYVCPVRAGAWPLETGSSEDFYHKFYKFVEWAVNLMASLYFPFVKNALDLVYSLLSGYDSEIAHDCLAISIYVWYCVSFEISITAPPPEEKMSASERRKYGIKEIPSSDVKERGTKRGLSQETIEVILKGGKPVYTAPILPGEVTLRRAWSSKI